MDAATRKTYPMATGLLDYFPNALMEVAHLSKVGNDQHNPGQPLHWDKAKSMDHADALMRHLKDRGTRDTDGERHSTKVAWRALANLEIELLQERAKLEEHGQGQDVEAAYRNFQKRWSARDALAVDAFREIPVQYTKEKDAIVDRFNKARVVIIDDEVVKDNTGLRGAAMIGGEAVRSVNDVKIRIRGEDLDDLDLDYGDGGA